MIRDGGDTLTIKGFGSKNRLFTHKLTIQLEMDH